MRICELIEELYWRNKIEQSTMSRAVLGGKKKGPNLGQITLIYYSLFTYDLHYTSI